MAADGDIEAVVYDACLAAIEEAKPVDSALYYSAERVLGQALLNVLEDSLEVETALSQAQDALEAKPWQAVYNPRYNLWLFPWAASGGIMDLPGLHKVQDFHLPDRRIVNKRGSSLAGTAAEEVTVSARVGGRSQ